MTTPTYGNGYYDTVYAGFEDPGFARLWAFGCGIACGFADCEVENVLEFGAGLGQNLAIVKARNKWAVDVSDRSRISCESQNFVWQNSLDLVPDNFFNLLLSRHSLEHVENPLEILRALRTKTVRGGVLYIVVPVEKVTPVSSLSKFDEHGHLFSWTPETIKNLLLTSGWTIENIWIHNNALFRRSLILLPKYPGLFLRLRHFVSSYLPLRCAEIVATCRAKS